VVSTIADEPVQMTSNSPILILGEAGIRIAHDNSKEVQDGIFLPVYSITEAFEHLQKGNAEGLIISREWKDIPADELVNLVQKGSSWFLLLWPPDEVLVNFIRFIGIQRRPENEHAPDDMKELHARIASLESRNTSLEASVRTLLAALSQCDPLPEAYAGDENAWELILQGVPVADLDSGDYQTTGDQEFDEEDETDNKIDDEIE